MPDSGGNGQGFSVHYSAAVGTELKQLIQSASPPRRKLIAAAFRRILQMLRNDPMRAGEPLFRLPGLRMQIRTVVLIPLVIDFAVCEDRPLVFIRAGRLLGESNL
jgi:hypothetical protein